MSPIERYEAAVAYRSQVAAKIVADGLLNDVPVDDRRAVANHIAGLIQTVDGKPTKPVLDVIADFRATESFWFTNATPATKQDTAATGKLNLTQLCIQQNAEARAAKAAGL